MQVGFTFERFTYHIKYLFSLLRSSDKFELTIIGSGPRKWIKTVANKLNIYNNIKWVKEIERNELNKYYVKSDAFLFPSLHDSEEWLFWRRYHLVYQ